MNAKGVAMMVVLWPLHHWTIHRKVTATASLSLLSQILLNILKISHCNYAHTTHSWGAQFSIATHSGNTKQLAARLKLAGSCRKCSFYGSTCNCFSVLCTTVPFLHSIGCMYVQLNKHWSLSQVPQLQNQQHYQSLHMY